MSDSQTLDLTNVSVPDVEEVVEDVPDNEVPVVSEVVVEEAAEEPVSSEAEVSEAAAEEPVSSEVVEEPVTITLEPVVSSPEPSAPIEQVVSDIREILADVPAPDVSEEATLESSDSNVLTDDLKQRIAELDYLRELCSDSTNKDKIWLRSNFNFKNVWKNKSVSVDSNVNYEEKLIQFEKMPELIMKWSLNRSLFKENNYFKNINDYSLDKPLFKENQNTERKIEVLEQLINLLSKSEITKKIINEFINNLY